MEINFNSDGSVEGLATKAIREFLSQFGEIVEFGNSKIYLINKDGDREVYEIEDETGHDCSQCQALTHNFMLIKSNSEAIICTKCFKLLGMR